ncbi:MAG TPA: LysE family translocator [Terriglobales bacterium]|nr:LysE family translocator [Terriglobales bacterium]
MLQLIATFAAVSALLTATPGPDNLLVLRNGLHGRRPAIATGLGVSIAAIAWGIAAAFGLAALLQRSQPLFDAVRVAGALYLCYLGVRSLIAAARKDPRPEHTSMNAGPAARGSWHALRTGVVTDLMNPKTGLLYVALVPQLIPHTVSVLEGTLLFSWVDAIVAGGFLAVMGWFAASAVEWLRRPRVRRITEGAAGVSLIGIGVRTALERT